MGKSSSKPYVIDYFDSNDEADEFDNWRSLVKENQKHIHGSNLPNKNEHVIGTSKKHDYEETLKTMKKGLQKILKLQERGDFEGAKRITYLLIHDKFVSAKSTTITTHDDLFALKSRKIATSSSFTSSWSSKSNEKLRGRLATTSDLLNALDDNDLKDGKHNSQTNLASDCDTCQSHDEQDVAKAAIFHSRIPRLTWQSLGETSIQNNDGKTLQKSWTRSTPSRYCSKYLGETKIPRLLKVGRPSSEFSVTVEQPSNDASLSQKTQDLASCVAVTSLSINSKTSLSEPICVGCTCPDKEKNIFDRSLTMESNVINSIKMDNTSPSDIKSSDVTRQLKTVQKNSGSPILKTRQDKHQMLRSFTVKNAKVTKESNESPSRMCSKMAAKAPRVPVESLDSSERKVLDLKRWYCISRPQYKTACGISSVISCWNFLFSTMGHGSLRPITQEAAMKLLGIYKSVNNPDFGLIADNITLFRWFQQLSLHFKVSGRCCFLYKPVGRNRTVGMTDETALSMLKQSLRDPNSALIYHCYKHYLCPIGYEDTSELYKDAYRDTVQGNVETWVLTGDTKRQHRSIHCVSWEHICQDLNCRSPTYFDIRQDWKGVMLQEVTTTADDNVHCIMLFQKVTESVLKSPNMISSSKLTSNSPHLDNPLTPSTPQMFLSSDTYRLELVNLLNVKSVDEDEIMPKHDNTVMKFQDKPHHYRNLLPRIVSSAEEEHKRQTPMKSSYRKVLELQSEG